MFDYDVESAKAVDELDKYDLTHILKSVNGIDVHDVAEEIRNFGDSKLSNAVDSLTDDELVLYLERRYKMYSTEEVRSYMWWGRG